MNEETQATPMSSTPDPSGGQKGLIRLFEFYTGEWWKQGLAYGVTLLLTIIVALTGDIVFGIPESKIIIGCILLGTSLLLALPYVTSSMSVFRHFSFAPNLFIVDWIKDVLVAGIVKILTPYEGEEYDRVDAKRHRGATRKLLGIADISETCRIIIYQTDDGTIQLLVSQIGSEGHAILMPIKEVLEKAEVLVKAQESTEFSNALSRVGRNFREKSGFITGMNLAISKEDYLQGYERGYDEGFKNGYTEGSK